MKIKVIPDDFIVEEIIDLPFAKNGQYTILQLEKKYWNTLDAIDFIARKLSVSKNRFSRAGLKDRYSLSTQYLSFKGIILKKIEEKNFTATPIGRSDQPVTPELLQGNSFRVTLRSLDKKEIETIKQGHQEVIRCGVPNFFDDQRFGSSRHRQGFFARSLMLGHYNGALKMFLAYPCAEDVKVTKEFKKSCAQNWGDWKSCRHAAPREFFKTINYLAENPKDLKNAIKTIEREMLNLFLLAYQSFLFNQALNLVIEEYGVVLKEIKYSMGKFLFYRDLKDPQHAVKTMIPMVNEKTCLSGLPGKKVKQVLDAENITLKDFGLRKMRFRGVRFREFLRPAILVPQDFSLADPLPDDLYKGKKKMELKFTLPSGSYATILVKRLAMKI